MSKHSAAFSLLPAHPHQIKSYYVSGTKIFSQRYTGIKIYRNIQTGKQFLAFKNGAIQIFFVLFCFLFVVVVVVVAVVF